MLVIAVIQKIVRDIVGRAQQDADTPGPIVLVVQILVLRQLFGVAVALLTLAGDADRQLVRDDRDIDRRFIFLVVVIAEADTDIALVIEGGAVRLNRDQAADRVLAEQGTLRALD